MIPPNSCSRSSCVAIFIGKTSAGTSEFLALAFFRRQVAGSFRELLTSAGQVGEKIHLPDDGGGHLFLSDSASGSDAAFPRLDFLLQEALDVLFAGQFELVLGDEELVVHAGQGVFDEGVVFLRAEQKADGRVVAVGHHVLAVPAHVGVELADVLVAELLDFQIDQHMALEDAVIEDEIDEAVGVADEDALLAGLETEAVAQFEQEILRACPAGGPPDRTRP